MTTARAGFYVYVIFDPAGQPRYVGKGKGDRWRIHEWKGSHNRKLADLFAANVNLPVSIVREGMSEPDAFDLEIRLIAIIGRADLNEGPLLNRTFGGEGGAGAVHSSGTRQKRSATLKITANNLPGRLASPIAKAGVPLPPSIREKMRESKRGKKQSAAHVAARAAAIRGRPLSEAHRSAISQGNKGIPRPTPEWVRPIIAAKVKELRRWCTPEGVVYRSPARKSDADAPGRRLAR